MFDPITFPRAIPFDPFKTERREANNSGVEVPNPTKTSPMTREESPIFFATPTDPSTSKFPPQTSNDNPIISIK